jgi:hypothetical protein
MRDQLPPLRAVLSALWKGHDTRSALWTGSISATPSSASSGAAATWPISRLLGLDAAFRRRLLGLLDLGYKCRLRLPLFVSAGFLLCHLVSNFVPRVEINVQVVNDEDDDDDDGQHEEGDEGDSDLDDSESPAPYSEEEAEAEDSGDGWEGPCQHCGGHVHS